MAVAVSNHIKVEPNDQGPIYRETDMSRIPVNHGVQPATLFFYWCLFILPLRQNSATKNSHYL